VSEPAWVIVRSRSRCEDIVERGFRDAGYRAYVPRFRVLTWPHGAQRKPAATMRALFAGLVFVQDWRGWPHERISQVIGLMPWGLNRSPATLSSADIAVLMDRERRGVYEPHAPRPPANGVVIRADLTIGEQVEYELAGQTIEGVLSELSESGRATIRVAMLGRDVDLPVEAADLRAAG
jgi:hypothetical protein